MGASSKCPKSSTVGIKYPALRDDFFQTGDIWFEGKRIDDNLDGLWRVHNKIYDFKSFVQNHPGGPDWLELTQGTDITEAFEAHHISTFPESLLAKFYVRDADGPRNYPFTYSENGFYRTLKKQVREKLKEVPESVARKSKLVADGLLVLFLTSAWLAVKTRSWWLGTLSGMLLGMTSIAGHNFFHQRNNLRMYYFDLNFMSSRGWRISHVLSHHLYTNTINDYEISSMEPFFQFLPHDKGNFARFSSVVLSPVIYALTAFAHYFFFVYQFCRSRGSIRPECFLVFVLFFALYATTSETLYNVSTMYLWIQVIGSLHCVGVALNVGHHDPDLFHDGDAARPPSELDWGVHQVDTVINSTTTTGNQFVVLTNFGDHCLHHLFPTIDQGKLKYLYPIFFETCKEFGMELQYKTSPRLVLGLLKQLANVKHSKVPPKALLKKVQ